MNPVNIKATFCNIVTILSTYLVCLCINIQSTRYGIGDDDINIEELVCTGVESHILRCHYKAVSQQSECQHHHDVGIICCEYMYDTCMYMY